MGEMSNETRTQTFQTPAPVKLRVDIPKGRIKVTAAETGDTRVELIAIGGDPRAQAMIAEAEVAQNGDEIVVRVRKDGPMWFGWGGSIEALVTAPLASHATLSTGAGRVETTGRLGDVDAHTGAGAIVLDECAEARARTGSGNITIASATGSADAKTGSGRVHVGNVAGNVRISTGAGSAELDGAGGEATLSTGSGNIEVGEGGDAVEASCGSGNIKVRRVDHGRVRAKTTSGGVSVGVAQGVAALLDLSTMSGRVSSELDASGPPAEGEAHVELVLNTISGNVNVARV
jgi:hypothetical protein